MIIYFLSDKLCPMNSKIETCVQCPVQCRLEYRSVEIVSFVTNIDPTPTSQEIRGQVSKMSQEANRIGCPESEIARLRRETLEQINPKLVREIEYVRSFRTAGRSNLRPDPIRGETYAQYRYRMRKLK